MTSAAYDSAVVASTAKMAVVFGITVVNVKHLPDGTDCEHLIEILSLGFKKL